jgi:hypothetical protein
MSESKSSLILPSANTMVKAMKLSIKYTKPIDCYFYLESTKGNISLMSDGETTLIYKNDEEHTSPVIKHFPSDDDLIIITENTIYLIHGSTPVKSVSD